jgi:hypothetical protein
MSRDGGTGRRSRWETAPRQVNSVSHAQADRFIMAMLIIKAMVTIVALLVGDLNAAESAKSSHGV